MANVPSRRGSKELPASLQQQQRNSVDDSDREEETARQQRIYIESTAGYLRASRARSSELHGVVYLSEPEVAPAETTQPTSTMQQQHADQQIHSDSSADSADAGVMLQDVEGGKTGQHSPAGQQTDSKVMELLEPIGGPGQEKLVLGFENLSVWAPVNPKKANALERGFKKAVTCGKKESNPQRQILFDVSGQVGALLRLPSLAAAVALPALAHQHHADQIPH